MLSSSTASSRSTPASSIGVECTTTTITAHGPRAPGSQPPTATGIPVQQPAPQPSVPVWRTVGEKSALRQYLNVLGVSPEASLADVRGAYKKLALFYHPDRSDAPNARMKFQEVSQAYMALCVEEGDAQEIDIALYERETQEACDMEGCLVGMAGVTAGLAGVFGAAFGNGVGGGAYSPFMQGLTAYNKSLGGLSGAVDALHLDLYRNGGVKPKHAPGQPLTCTCHPLGHQASPLTSNAHAHNANCQSHASLNLDAKSAVSEPQPVAQHELDIASAVAADVSLLTGVLAPPIIAVGDNNVQVRIAPLAHPPCPVVYQIQLKIKKSYQLVYQGTALSYTVPNLVPGTRYAFRVRAVPAVGTIGRVSDSDDDLDIDGMNGTHGGGTEEIFAEPDEATGLGMYSQPTTVTTQGTKPEGNAPHPPVLSNLQLAALKRKDGAKGKKKAAGKQAKDVAAADQKGGSATPPQQPINESSTPTNAATTTATPAKASRSVTATATSTPAPSSPVLSPTNAAPSSSSLTTSTPALSKKEAAAKRKAEEEARRLSELETARQKALEEEVAYQKFLLAAREEQERLRLKEEQAELERYAKMKEEQDAKRKEEEAAAAAAAAARKTKGRNAKNKQAESAATNTAAANKKEATTATPARGKKGQQQAAAAAAAAAPASPAKAPATQLKSPQSTALLPTPAATSASATTTTPASDKTSGRNKSKKGDIATNAPILASPPVKGASAWGSPAAPVAAAAVPKPSPVLAAAASTPSPIIRSKQAGAPAWTSTTLVQPLSTATAQVVESTLHDRSTLPQLSLAPASLPSTTAAPSLLTEHLHRFDSTKPAWQADLITQQQLREQQQLQQSHLQHQQHYAQAQLEPTTTAAQRYSSHLAYSSSHSLLPSLSTSAFSSSLVDRPVGGGASAAWNTSVVDDDDHLLLSDLQHELERERWNNAAALSSPTSAAAEAAWNSTANTTIPSHSIIGGGSASTGAAPSLHFAPLSSLLADTPPSRTTGHDGIYMPTASTHAARESLSNPYAGTTTAAAAPVGPSALLSYSSLNAFPTTSGLSRDAPSFSPSSASLVSEPPSAGAPLLSHHAVSGHTRLPLSAASTASLGSAPVGAVGAGGSSLSGIFNSFALPSFTSFSSLGGGASSLSTTGSSVTSGAGGSGLDWSTHSTASTASLHSTAGSPSSALLADDADDLQLYPHHHQIAALATTDDEVILPSRAALPKW